MLNQNIIIVFEKLINEKQKNITQLKEDKEKNKVEIKQITFKVINFRKALNAIKNYDSEITKGEDLKSIKGIGKGVISRIDEILEKGTLSEIKENLDYNNNSFTKQEDLQKITGIGPSKAIELFKKNITLDKLLDEMKKIDGNFEHIKDENILSNLTHHQLLGVKYYHDIDTKIPREEIKSIQIKLSRFIKQLDSKYEVHICGSFRRKKPTSGDIDVLILHPEFRNQQEIDENDENILGDIVEHLSKKKFLIDHLTEGGRTKYMGICKNKKTGLGRRIDIRFIPYESKAPAILYFTGSGNFNKYMRAEALKKGYTINEYGIYKTKKISGKNMKDKKMNVKTEKDIFDIVGIEYLKPENRI